MPITEYEAPVPGECDICHGPYEAGDRIGFVGEDIICPVCILAHHDLEAS